MCARVYLVSLARDTNGFDQNCSGLEFFIYYPESTSLVDN